MGRRGRSARVSLLRTDHLGASMARNVGIASTEGEYVVFLDADDRWLPSKLARQIELLADGAAFAHTVFDLMDETGERIGLGWGARVGYLDMLAGNLGVLQSSAMVRRDSLEAVGMFNPLLWVQQDLDLFLKLAHLGPPAYAETIEVEYRIHGGNLSRDYWRAIQELLLMYDLHEVAALREWQRCCARGDRQGPPRGAAHVLVPGDRRCARRGARRSQR